MRLTTICGPAVCLLLSAMPLQFAHAESTTPSLSLEQYVSDLQRNPGDSALREKIIKLAQAMNPSPAIPEEARRHYVLAKTLFEGAKELDDLNDSVAEFRKALLVAPWWPEANRDLGLVLEAAGQFDEATTYVKLYMATHLSDDQTRAAQDEIYKIEAKKQLATKAAQKSRPEAIAAKQENEYEAWLKKLDGARYVNDETPGVLDVIEIRGAQFVVGIICGASNTGCGRDYGYGFHEQSRTPIHNRGGSISMPGPFGVDEYTYAISPDGETVTSKQLRGGRTLTETYRREK